MPFPITPYDHIALCTELSALLAAAPVELRTVNLSDRFTFAGGVGQDFDDGLADFDATDFVDEDDDDDAHPVCPDCGSQNVASHPARCLDYGFTP